jgi:hypothetical protein
MWRSVRRLALPSDAPSPGTGAISMGRRFLSRTAPGFWCHSTRAADSFTPHLRTQIVHELRPLESDAFPFAERGSRKRSHWGEGLTSDDMQMRQWLRPDLVVEVALSSGLNPDGPSHRTGV